jgi:hypothetical protein
MFNRYDEVITVHENTSIASNHSPTERIKDQRFKAKCSAISHRGNFAIYMRFVPEELLPGAHRGTNILEILPPFLWQKVPRGIEANRIASCREVQCGIPAISRTLFSESLISSLIRQIDSMFSESFLGITIER